MSQHLKRGACRLGGGGGVERQWGQKTWRIPWLYARRRSGAGLRREDGGVAWSTVDQAVAGVGWPELPEPAARRGLAKKEAACGCSPAEGTGAAVADAGADEGVGAAGEVAGGGCSMAAEAAEEKA